MGKFEEPLTPFGASEPESRKFGESESQMKARIAAKRQADAEREAEISAAMEDEIAAKELDARAKRAEAARKEALKRLNK